MAADLHAAPLHRKEVVPCEVAGLSDVVRHHVEDRLHPALLEHGQDDAVVVLVAVVKGEDDGLFWQRLLALARACVVLRRDRRIPLGSEIIELLGKVRRRHHIRFRVGLRVLRHHVVLEDGKARRRLCGQNPRCKRHEQEHGQRQPLREQPRNSTDQIDTSSAALRIFRRR